MADQKSSEKQNPEKKVKVKAPKAPKAEKEAPVEKAAPPMEAPAGPKPTTKSTKVGKLLAKNKSRLPRREKKAQKKAAGRL